MKTDVQKKMNTKVHANIGRIHVWVDDAQGIGYVVKIQRDTSPSGADYFPMSLEDATTLSEVLAEALDRYSEATRD